jgi:hypothetical protein
MTSAITTIERSDLGALPLLIDAAVQEVKQQAGGMVKAARNSGGANHG